MEALGLLEEITAPNFLFDANLVYKVLTLLNPTKKLLQREDTGFWTGLWPVQKSTLHCDEGYTKV